MNATPYALIALTAVFLGTTLSVTACGGGGGAGTAAVPATTDRAGALSASQPGELLTFAREKLRERASLRENGPAIDMDFGSPDAVLARSSTTAGASVLRSRTMVQ